MGRRVGRTRLTARRWAARHRRWLFPALACIVAAVPLTTLIADVFASQPPTRAPNPDDGLLVFASETNTGATWGWASIDEPVPIDGDDPIEVRFWISSTTTTGLSIVVGDATDLSSPSCYGDGWELATGVDAASLSAVQKAAVSEYLAVAPVTGEVSTFESSRTSDVDEVEALLDRMSFIVAVPTVFDGSPVSRTSRPGESAVERTYSARNAQLTCAFDPGEFWQTWGDDKVFTFPDTVAAQGVVGGDAGPQSYVYVDRRFAFAPDETYAMNYSTIEPDSSDATGQRFVKWWGEADFAERKTVAVSEARTVFTSTVGEDYRQLRFIVIGFLTSILIALLPILIDAVAARPARTGTRNGEATAARATSEAAVHDQ